MKIAAPGGGNVGLANRRVKGITLLGQVPPGAMPVKMQSGCGQGEA
jgi:hypothetical protein